MAYELLLQLYRERPADFSAQRMAQIRNGLGAAVLPKDVKAMHLAYASKINGGHMGPRYEPAHCDVYGRTR